MKTFIAAALAATSALAISQSDTPLDDYCCEVYSSENYGGVSEQFCLGKDMRRNYRESSAMSFTRGELNDTVESFKCGMQVGVKFCNGMYTQSIDGSQECQGGDDQVLFVTTNGGMEIPTIPSLQYEEYTDDEGNVDSVEWKGWKNLTSSIILFQQEPGNVISLDCITTVYEEIGCVGDGEVSKKLELNQDEQYVSIMEAESLIQFPIRSILLASKARVQLYNKVRFNTEDEGAWMLGKENKFESTATDDKCICVNMKDFKLDQYEIKSLQFTLNN